VALAASPLLLPELASFFYQPRLLALTHTLTLGWVSLTSGRVFGVAPPP
jgi:hypothetical protein